MCKFTKNLRHHQSFWRFFIIFVVHCLPLLMREARPQFVACRFSLLLYSSCWDFPLCLEYPHYGQPQNEREDSQRDKEKGRKTCGLLPDYISFFIEKIASFSEGSSFSIIHHIWSISVLYRIAYIPSRSILDFNNGFMFLCIRTTSTEHLNKFSR